MTEKRLIVIAEDDDTARETLAEEYRDLGFEVLEAADGREALAYVEQRQPSLLITDLKMPEVDGMELVMKLGSKLPIILMTAYGTITNAVKAMEEGAFSFVEKPVDWKHLLALTKKALEMGELKKENQSLQGRLENSALKALVGESSAMEEVRAKIRQVAATDTAVLVTGESGTGKELAVSAIQALSRRAKGPFVKVNCAAIPESLMESELFGHEKGAYTGALSLGKGKFELADNGTLLLDEIAEMRPEMQSKLLRVLQDGEFCRLGSSKIMKADFRLLCATNANIKERIQEGLFRSDLYYRIGVFTIALPPLREREGDVALLGSYFLSRSQERMGKKIAGFSKEAMEALSAYSWPGNVRQLQNAVEYACVLAEQNGAIELDCLPEEVIGAFGKTGPKKVQKPAEKAETPQSSASGLSLREMEKQAILSALERHNGSKPIAAKELGIGLKTIYRKIEEYALEKYK